MTERLASPQSQTEVGEKRYIMIREPLDKCFNSEQWQEICSHNRYSYYRIQTKIMNSLLQNEEFFNKYFHTFYENHVTLYHWYLLARENQHDLGQYIFKKILKRTFQSYKEEVKITTEQQAEEKLREKSSLYRIRSNPDKITPLTKVSKIEDLSQEIFKFMSTKSATASLLVRQKPWLLKGEKGKSKTVEGHDQIRQSNKSSSTNKSTKENSQLRINQKHDFHQLYVETFHACRGYSYIFYNREKHLKGQSEREKYNDFIRGQGRSKGGSRVETREGSPLERSGFGSLRVLEPFGENGAKFEYSFYGGPAEKELNRQKSEIVFRRIGSKNFGKFIRR